jgi:hypothetical protein
LLFLLLFVDDFEFRIDYIAVATASTCAFFGTTARLRFRSRLGTSLRTLRFGSMLVKVRTDLLELSLEIVVGPLHRVRVVFLNSFTDGGDRDRVLAALRAELDWAEHPTVLVIEDIHWADDATLDALRYLIRRIADLPAVLVLTYRDDEADRGDALYGLLGEASRSGHVRHLALRRLSHEAVRQLSAGSPVAADELFALTSGNPFFVDELLASARGDRVPRTIVDAVMAAARR